MDQFASVAPVPPPLPDSSQPKAVLPKSRHGDFNNEADPDSPRTIYLLVYPIAYSATNAGRAHWGVFVPELGCSEKGPGTSIDVVGSPFLGYTLQFTRDCDLHDIISKVKIIPLGQVDAKHVKDGAMPNQVDSDAIDDLEVVAKRIPAPGKSPDPLDPHAGETCQAWTRKYVTDLIRVGIFQASALENLEQAKELYNSKPKVGQS